MKLYVWAWRQRGIDPTARLVLLALVERADNRKHECFPSHETIAADTELQRKAVGKAMLRLEALGLISRQYRSRPNGSRTSDLITLHPEVDASSRDQESRDPQSRDGEPRDSEADTKGLSGPHQGTLEPASRDSESLAEEPRRDHRSEPRRELTHAGPSFDDFWAIYPRKKDKAAARRAWSKAVKTTSPEVVLEAAREYARQRWSENPLYTKYPASWLNAGAWDDEPDQPRQGPVINDKSRGVLELIAQQRKEAGHGEVRDHPAALARLEG